MVRRESEMAQNAESNQPACMVYPNRNHSQSRSVTVRPLYPLLLPLLLRLRLVVVMRSAITLGSSSSLMFCGTCLVVLALSISVTLPRPSAYEYLLRLFSLLSGLLTTVLLPTVLPREPMLSSTPPSLSLFGLKLIVLPSTPPLRSTLTSCAALKRIEIPSLSFRDFVSLPGRRSIELRGLTSLPFLLVLLLPLVALFPLFRLLVSLLLVWVFLRTSEPAGNGVWLAAGTLPLEAW